MIKSYFGIKKKTTTDKPISIVDTEQQQGFIKQILKFKKGYSDNYPRPFQKTV